MCLPNIGKRGGLLRNLTLCHTLGGEWPTEITASLESVMRMIIKCQTQVVNLLQGELVQQNVDNSQVSALTGGLDFVYTATAKVSCSTILKQIQHF